AGGQQVQQGAAEHREDEGAFGLPVLAPALLRGLRGAEHGQPVVHGGPREAAPRSVRVDQRPGVRLDPQAQQSAVFRRDEPPPEGPRDLRQGPEVVVVGVVDALEQRQLVLTGPGEQGADQAVLALEQVEQHAGARSDRRRQRAERQLADPVFQDVAVGPVEQLDLPGGRRVGGLRHAEDPVAETNVSAAVYAGPATPRPDRRLTNRWAATPTA